MYRTIRIAGLVALMLLLAAAPTASAGTPLVDPSVLEPPPPPGADCQAVGGSTVICHTAISFPSVAEPVFEVGCGTVYQNATDDRTGIRWYRDGKIVARHVGGHLDGSWSLSPDGSGTAIRFTGNWTSSSRWTVPGDDDTLVETFHGRHFKATAPGLGSSLLLAGQIEPDGTVHGINTIDEPLGQISPDSLATIESILCG